MEPRLGSGEAPSSRWNLDWGAERRPGRCPLVWCKPSPCACDLGECAEVPCRLLEARGDGAEAFQVVEEALDEIALTVQRASFGGSRRSLGLGADDGPLLLVSDGLPES